ncbi:Type II toxin-antitoxin system MqsR family toxin [Bacillus sp. IT-13CA1]
MSLHHQNSTSFLREAKRLISSGKYDYIPRTYNHPTGREVRWIEALLDIGLTDPKQIWQEILTLKPCHYFSGPLKDHARPHEGLVIWIFKKDINNVTVYIKLRIRKKGDCVCLSFHKDW